jgi:hypothetical protein
MPPRITFLLWRDLSFHAVACTQENAAPNCAYVAKTSNVSYTRKATICEIGGEMIFQAPFLGMRGPSLTGAVPPKEFATNRQSLIALAVKLPISSKRREGRFTGLASVLHTTTVSRLPETGGMHNWLQEENNYEVARRG